MIPAVIFFYFILFKIKHLAQVITWLLILLSSGTLDKISILNAENTMFC